MSSLYDTPFLKKVALLSVPTLEIVDWLQASISTVNVYMHVHKHTHTPLHTHTHTHNLFNIRDSPQLF